MRLLSNKYFFLALLLLSVMPSVATAIYNAFHDHWCDYWPTFNYFIGYEYGFGGRKLIGSLLGSMMPEFVTAKHIRNIILPANILMLLGMVWLVWRSLSDRITEAAPMVILLAIYAASPFSIFVFVNSHLSIAFMETYQLVLLLGWLLLYIRYRGTWYYYAGTFVVAILGTLIHHTFCCTLFPMMLSLILFDLLEDGKLHRWRLAIYGICILVMGGGIFTNLEV